MEVAGLEFSYGPAPVLAGLDFELRAGEVFGLLGPNGSGKSTLVRILCGRLAPKAGRVRIGGIDPRGARRVGDFVGLVPQKLAVYPHLTAAENLAAFARLAGMPGARVPDAVKWALATARLESVAGTRVEQLSGGYQRRVNLAAGIVHRPGLLVMDEPTVGMDLEARAGVARVLADLRGAGMGVLLVSHDLDGVEDMADRVGFLRAGRLDPVGRPADLLDAEFGSKLDWQVVLRAEPLPDQVDGLRHAGLEPDAPDRRRWRLFAAPDSTTAAGLETRLERAGLEVDELRVRRPGLARLYQALEGDRPLGGDRP